MNNDIDYDYIDILTERPHDFTVGKRHFKMYPVTLAKTFVINRLMDGLNINRGIIKVNPWLEALRVAKENRETCSRIIAYHSTPNSYKSLYDRGAIEKKKDFFTKNLSDEDLASLMIIALSCDKTDAVMEHLGIDKERKRFEEVMNVKKKHDKGTFSFGGKSLFAFISQLKEMGYSDEEILFVRGYSYLRLMLADKITTLNLTDDEMSELPSELGGSYMDANNPANAQKIVAALMNRGIGAVGHKEK